MLAETGTLSFIDIADANGTQNMQNSYGAEFVDFDDDGDLDLYMAGADRQPTKILRNNGGNQFTDVDTITGHPLLSDPAGDLDGGRAVDYDNDGDLDLYFHNNAARHPGPQALSQRRELAVHRRHDRRRHRLRDRRWLRQRLGRHRPRRRSGSHRAEQRGPAQPFPERVFISDASTNGNHWLYLRLHGPADNTTGIGASLYATIDEGTPDERTLRREANTNAGTFNQSDLPVHFGLGAADLIDQLRVVWPDGTVQFLQDVAVDQYLTIDFPTPLAGDYNTDGIVDAADYTVWRNRLGSGVSLPNDSTPGVGQDDYIRWKNNFGATTAGGAAISAGDATIPEPSVAALLAICLAVMGMKPRRIVR